MKHKVLTVNLSLLDCEFLSSSTKRRLYLRMIPVESGCTVFFLYEISVLTTASRDLVEVGPPVKNVRPT